MTNPEYHVSFVLPMFNEAANIADTIGRVSRFAGSLCASYEIVVSDDASTDEGPAISKKPLRQGRPHKVGQA